MKYKIDELAEELWDQYVDLNYWYLNKLIGSGPFVGAATLTGTYAGIGYTSGRFLGSAFGMPAAGGRYGAMKGLHTLRSIQIGAFMSPTVRLAGGTAFGVHAIFAGGEIASAAIAGQEGVDDYHQFLTEPKHMPTRTSWSIARLIEYYK